MSFVLQLNQISIQKQVYHIKSLNPKHLILTRMSNIATAQQFQLVSPQQLSLLRQLSQFQSVVQFHSLAQIPLLDDSNEGQLKQGNKLEQSQNTYPKQLSSKLSWQVSQSPSLKNKKSSFLLQSPQSNKLQSSYQPLLLLNKQLQTSGPKEYYQLKARLLSHRQKSEQIYRVGQFIKSYQLNFSRLVGQKYQLVRMLGQIKGETCHLVERQRKLIDLSFTLKDSLDYYTYHEKHQFDFPCEISCRQVFEDTLQPTLSTVMDGLQFFTQNQTYASSKKHLGQYLSSKSKILSFIKSFYIKLFNKQNNFVIKYLQANKIHSQLNMLYPKSRPSLLMHFLLTFPQFKKYLKELLSLVKDSNNGDKQQDVNFLQMREHQISQFMLSDSNTALIRYLEKNNSEIYSEIMLNLWTFNRFNFHENLVFSWARAAINQNMKKTTQTDEGKLATQKWQSLRGKIYFTIQTIVAEYLYFLLCCHPSSPQSQQGITSFLYKLTFKYLQILIKQSRQLVLKFKYGPFQLCSKIQHILDVELRTYFQNLNKQQYESYVMGRLWSQLRQAKGDPKDEQQSKFLRQILNDTVKAKMLSQLGQYCFQALPKIQPSQKVPQIEQSINRLIYFIPKLQYCPSNAENYVISSLDTIIKSIKQINVQIESRFQCYAWNLLAFGSIRTVLRTKKLEIVSKEIRFDFNESLNIIDRVKRLQRPESLIKYAQDIFNVIKTGMPLLNQLTLDFNKYVDEHYEMLESRFLKDILFIYAKNMIQFLQKVMSVKRRMSSQIQNPSRNDLQQPSQQKQKIPRAQRKNSKHYDNQIAKLCQPLSMKSLCNSYVLSIEKYIKQSLQILRIAEQSKIEGKEDGIANLKTLIKEVYQKLFDFLDTFYVTLSEQSEQITSQFDEISKIKESQEALWLLNTQFGSKERIKVI